MSFLASLASCPSTARHGNGSDSFPPTPRFGGQKKRLSGAHRVRACVREPLLILTPSGDRPAHPLDQRRVLQVLAGDVERQVLGVDHALEEAHPLRQDVVGLGLDQNLRPQPAAPSEQQQPPQPPPQSIGSMAQASSISDGWLRPVWEGREDPNRIHIIGRQAVDVQVPRPPPSHWKRLRGFSNILGLDAAPPAPGCCTCHRDDALTSSRGQSSRRVATQRSLWGSGRVLGVVTVETRPARAAARNARHQRLCVDVPDGDSCDGIWGSGRRRRRRRW
eukprot:COSAG01_NODE_8898_length_2622_cov_1.340864_3_plen_277_part_00